MSIRGVRLQARHFVPALVLLLAWIPVRSQDPVFSAVSFEDSLSTRTTQAKPFLVDIDTDGDLDAFVGEDDGNLSFFRNSAGVGKDPVFVAQGGADPFGLTDVSGESVPFLGDIDGDGDIDALIGSSDGTFTFFRNSAGAGVDPVFAAEGGPSPFGLPDVGAESAPFLVDVDGDQDLDAFVGEEDGNINFFRNSAGPNADPVFVAEGGLAPFGLTAVGIDSAPFIGDVDGDNDLDALVGEEEGRLTFYRNSAASPTDDPIFAPEGGATPFGLPDIGVDTGPFLADIDGDGDLDALIGEQCGQVSFFRNLAGVGVDPLFVAEGSGTPFGLTDLGFDSDPFLADIDGDGDLDAFSGETDGFIRFFRNIAGPGMTPLFVAEAGDEPFGLTPVLFESSPFLIDIEGDGDLDAVIGDAFGFLNFFRNTAGFGVDPVFVPEGGAMPFGLLPGPGSADPYLGDIDGDGDVDALIGYFGGETALFRNTAGPMVDPVFVLEAFPAPLGLVQVLGEASPFLADLDGDNDLDALIGDSVGNISFFRNSAGPGVDPAFSIGTDFTPFGLPLLDLDASPFLGDIDGDGDVDALFGNDNGHLSFFRNMTGPGPGDPAFVPEDSPVPFGLPPVGFQSVPFLVDVEGDGDLDAFIGEDLGNVNFLRNIAGNGSDPLFVAEGSFQPFGLPFFFADPAPFLADIDGDMDVDALVGDDLGNLSFFRNTAGPGVDPVFVFGGVTAFGLSNVGSDGAPFLIDIEGDNDLDAVSGESGGAYFFFRNSAGPGVDPAFSLQGGANPFGLPTVAGDSHPTFADIDGDGDVDALVGDDDGMLTFLRNTAGPMNDPVFVAEGGATPFGLNRVAFDAAPTFADFDGDNDLDAVIGEEFGTMRVLRNVLNQAPAFVVPAVVMVAEDAPAQTLAGFASGIDDSDGGVDQALTFLVSNDNNALFSVQPALDPLSGDLTFTPAPNANGSAVVTVRLMDDGGTFGGGIDTSTEQFFTITVSPVDDPPVNVVPVAVQMAFQESAFTFSAGDGNGLSVIEVDGDLISTTLTVSNGTLQVVEAGAVIGNQTSWVEIQGTVAQVNAALASVTYLGQTGFSGPDTLTMLTQDLPAGLSDTSMVDIQVAVVETSLQLSKTALGVPSPLTIGSEFSYRLELTNTGGVTATNVEVTDPLPFPVSFVSSPCVTEVNQTLTWIVGSLAPSATSSCEFVVRVTSQGAIRNVARVAGGNTLPQDAEDEIEAPITVPTLGLWGALVLAAALAATACRLLLRA